MTPGYKNYNIKTNIEGNKMWGCGQDSTD